MDIKGNDYLPVQQRLRWFCEERQNWSIETNYIHLSETEAIAQAIIRDETGRIIRTAHKRETAKGFGDFHEKAETSAIGRALAMCGYGTQFTLDELSEGERIVDAPVTREVHIAKDFRVPNFNHIPTDAEIHEPGEDRFGPPPDDAPNYQFTPDTYVVTFGKFKGKTLEEIPDKEISGYCKWIEDKARASNEGISKMGAEFIRHAEDYLNAR